MSAPIQDRVVAAVTSEFGVTREDLFSRRRTKGVVFSRQVAMMLIRELGRRSMSETGQLFNRTHSDIGAACKRIRGLMDVEPETKALIETLKQKIYGNPS